MKYILLKQIFLIVLTLVSFTYTSQASQPEIVFLTSFSQNEEGIKFQSNIENLVQERLESIANNYSVRVIHQATAFEAWQSAHDPQVLAVIWVSHGSNQIMRSGMGIPSGIVDANGFNIAPVFLNPSPNIRFLGLVTCYSRSTAEQIHDDDLVVQSFKNKVFGIAGFKKTLRKLRRFLASPVLVEPPKVKTRDDDSTALTITRRAHEKKEHPALMVLIQNRVVGVLPAIKVEDEVQQLNISKELVKDQPSSVVFSSGASLNPLTLESIGVGEIEVKSTTAKYKTLTSSDGKKVGITGAIYLLDSEEQSK